MTIHHANFGSKPIRLVLTKTKPDISDLTADIRTDTDALISLLRSVEIAREHDTQGAESVFRDEAFKIAKRLRSELDELIPLLTGENNTPRGAA